MAKIKAIETVYNGYRFRSRMEAKWAVFFDTLRVEYDYEPQGFELGNGLRYLPDFWLSQVEMWAEVKPKKLNATEKRKCRKLAELSGHPVLQLIGIPDNKPYWAIHYGKDQNGIEDFYEIDYCLTMYKDYPTREKRFYCMPADGEGFSDTKLAAVTARGARFEFGECPTIPPKQQAYPLWYDQY